ncbi:MAG: phosphoribosyltransferase family protein [Planctomycetota bacterium]
MFLAQALAWLRRSAEGVYRYWAPGPHPAPSPKTSRPEHSCRRWHAQFRWCVGASIVGHGGGRVIRGVRAANDLLFPPCCAFCRGDIVPRRGEPLLCQGCTDRFRQQRSACPRCASPLPTYWNVSQFCPHCQRRNYGFERAEALGDYGAELQQAVLWMKRLAFEPLTWAVGGLLGRHVAVQLASWAPEWIVPIPMHFWRRAARGVQPSRVLAGQVAEVLGLPLREQLLRCRRKSHKQGTLTVAERFKNVRGAFSVSTGYDITNKRILLIDDIMTTGATASEAARILRKAGSGPVAVAVVARGVGTR